MSANAELRRYIPLKDKKARDESGLFLAEGRKVVEEGLRSGCPCERVFVREGFYGRYEETDALLSRAPALVLDDKDFSRLADTDEPQGLVGVFSSAALKADGPAGDVAVALDGVADPRNVGTIVRTADWFGFPDFLVGPGCADPFSPKAVRSSMGSVFRCRFCFRPDLEASLRALKDRYRVVVADLDGDDYRSFRGGPPSVFVFSNEARGPSDEVLALADAIATIPGAGRAESLSVAIAASVILAALAP